MTHRHFPFISSDLQPCYSSTDQHTPRPSPSAPQGLTNHRLSHPFTVPTSNDHLHPSDKFCACHKPSHYSRPIPSGSVSHPSRACWPNLKTSLGVVDSGPESAPKWGCCS